MRGAWIEMSFGTFSTQDGALSLPVRGAWIEMASTHAFTVNVRSSLPVRGAWIEIAQGDENQREVQGRSPCGERGLKFINKFKGGWA